MADDDSWPENWRLGNCRWGMDFESKESDIISIYVSTFTGKTISVDVKPSDTIGDVKSKIRAKEGIPLDEQALIFNKMVLDDTNIIQDFEIKKYSTLKLMHKSRGLMRIFVKIPKYITTISLEVKPSDTIENVKYQIWDKQGISTENQELIFNKMILEDSGTVVDFDIKRDSTLKLLFKSSGGSIKIFVETFTTRRTISLFVKPTDTIANVKDKINSQLHTPRSKQVLIFNNMVLDDSGTLADFNINKGSTLTLMRKSSGSIRIYINMQSGDTIVAEVKPLHTISKLKAKIREKNGLPSCQQRLLLNGKALEDGRTFADYHIYEECTLDFMLHQRGS